MERLIAHVPWSIMPPIIGPPARTYTICCTGVTFGRTGRTRRSMRLSPPVYAIAT